MPDHTVLRYDRYCPYQSVVTPVSLIKFGIMDVVRLKVMKKNLAFPHFSRKPIPALIKWGLGSDRKYYISITSFYQKMYGDGLTFFVGSFQNSEEVEEWIHENTRLFRELVEGSMERYVDELSEEEFRRIYGRS